jgi:DNA-binding transcriptional MerR regulator
MGAQRHLISSKEILQKTKISRATLNNYIKMGILPRPIVQPPKDAIKGVKKIGYFPKEVLDRIETVKRLKKEGRSMEDIAASFKSVPIIEAKEKGLESKIWFQDRIVGFDDGADQIYNKDVRLTLEYISCPAYLMNYNFKLLFNWEFHSRVQNWRDLIRFHMSFVKSKYSKTWIEKLYKGITEREVSLLEDIYDRVSTSGKESIQESNINLLMTDGTTESYKVYTLSFREGSLFSYASVEGLLRKG